jgi:hypothetical protein
MRGETRCHVELKWAIKLAKATFAGPESRVRATINCRAAENVTRAPTLDPLIGKKFG